MSRGALQKMLRRRRYKKQTEQIFCTRSEKNGLKIDPHVSNLKFIDFVFEGFRSTLNLQVFNEFAHQFRGETNYLHRSRLLGTKTGVAWRARGKRFLLEAGVRGHYSASATPASQVCGQGHGSRGYPRAPRP